MKKVTKREMFEAMKAYIETGACEVDVEAMVKFCEDELVALDKKNEKARERAAVKKAEADVLTDKITAVLTDEFQTIADIVSCIEDEEVTASKVTYRLTKLVEAETVEKTQLTIPVEGGRARRIQGYRLKPVTE